jgi:hypothetical protein
MEGWGRWTGECAWATRARGAGFAVVALATCVGAARGEAGDEAANARLKHPAERMAMARAIQGAANRLDRAECQGLLDEFADASGRPLRSVLEAQSLGIREYLDRVLFYDAPSAACQGATLAGMTEAGSRVIRVCGSRFARAMTENARYAEGVVIHEMLHSLGLGENPPTTYFITSRVQARCGDGGKLIPLAAVSTPGK